jgi:hypothetical protein
MATAQRRRNRLNLLGYEIHALIAEVPDQRYTLELWEDLFEQFEPFSAQLQRL